MVISIVVCTYNRGDLIKGCLDSLKNQTADPSTFEVLVIDNNSTDETCQIIGNYLSLPNFRLFREDSQGLSHARNRGIRESQGTYIAYLDDDARADEHYIENLLVLLDKFSDSIDCYGGPILPFYTSPKPDWFKDQYEIRRMRPEAGFQSKGQGFSGSNMIWKRSILDALGGFNPEVGIRGDKLILGEETLLFDRLWGAHNPKLYYSPKLIVFHWVPDFKMNVMYRLTRAKATGYFIGFEATINNAKKTKEIVTSFSNLLKLILRSVIRFPSYKKWQNWAVETISPVAVEIGKISQLLLSERY